MWCRFAPETGLPFGMRTSDLRPQERSSDKKTISVTGPSAVKKVRKRKKKYSKMHAPTLNQSSMVNGPDPETFLIRTTGGYAKMGAGC